MMQSVCDFMLNFEFKFEPSKSQQRNFSRLNFQLYKHQIQATYSAKPQPALVVYREELKVNATFFSKGILYV